MSEKMTPLWRKVEDGLPTDKNRRKWVTLLDEWDFGKPKVATASYNGSIWSGWHDGRVIEDVVAWMDYNVPDPYQPADRTDEGGRE